MSVLVGILFGLVEMEKRGNGVSVMVFMRMKQQERAVSPKLVGLDARIGLSHLGLSQFVHPRTGLSPLLCNTNHLNHRNF